MSTIVVEIMPKPEILDPQGKAVATVLRRSGHGNVSGIRIGKRVEVQIDGEPTEAALDEIRAVAAEVLSNPVIEDVVSVTAVEHA